MIKPTSILILSGKISEANVCRSLIFIIHFTDEILLIHRKILYDLFYTHISQGLKSKLTLSLFKLLYKIYKSCFHHTSPSSDNKCLILRILNIPCATLEAYGANFKSSPSSHFCMSRCCLYPFILYYLLLITFHLYHYIIDWPTISGFTTL
jgi:hypothetical protein